MCYHFTKFNKVFRQVTKPMKPQKKEEEAYTKFRIKWFLAAISSFHKISSTPVTYRQNRHKSLSDEQ